MQKGGAPDDCSKAGEAQKHEPQNMHARASHAGH